MNDQKNGKNSTLEFNNFPATKIQSTKESGLAPAANTPGRPFPIHSVAPVQEALAPRCPDPYEGFQPLSRYQIQVVSKLVMKNLHKICESKTPPIQIDFDYWRERTQELLSPKNAEEALIIPARAGAGKSTWLRAFLLSLIELRHDNNPLAEALGGVMLVIQKVEELNDIVALILRDFPKFASDVIALQSWSRSGMECGFCKKPGVSDFRECAGDRCEYRSSCDILRFKQQARQAYIIGMTQARFDILRKTGTLDLFLYRTAGLSSVPRRFLIFDEKFQFTPIQVLNKPLIDKASTELEALISRNRSTDYSVQSRQVSLSYHIDRVFQQLRQTLTVQRPNQPITDLPMGFCSLADANVEQKQKYRNFRDHISKQSAYATESIRACISVMDRLYDGEPCLFCKTNGFSIYAVDRPQLHYGDSQTLLFDATAEVDGDYCHLQNVRRLPSSKLRHMDRLTFYIHSNPQFNVSKSAMGKEWKLNALSHMICFILRHSVGKVFLCVYKQYAVSLAEDLRTMLPAEQYHRIQIMPDKTPPCLPYFNGTNGANCFNCCTNVILLGYPRLQPQTYLAATYAAWRDHGFEEEFKAACSSLGDVTTPWRYKAEPLPMVQAYQTLHLTARLEQEIYRCALRNYHCNEQIRVHLFAPAAEIIKELRSRFPGSEIEEDTDLPAEVRACIDQARSYKGKPTARGRLSDFISHWDGASIGVGELCEKLGISPAVWKDLMKDEHIRDLFESNHVQKCGRGIYARLIIPNSRCA